MDAPATAYDRWLGTQAPAARRVFVAAIIALAVALSLAWFAAWQLTVLSAWDAGALAFLSAVYPLIARADATRTQHHATREDLSRDTSRLVLLISAGVSLVAVVSALGLARRERGWDETLLVAAATLAVILSWTLVNSVFTLRYAHLYYSAPADGIAFGGNRTNGPPDYRDFAYLAFTIGMTYQVSDTTLRDRRIRRTVLSHALISYVYGVVIVATGVNIIAGLA
jgi:uncharacterized membrane protein